MFSKMQNIKPLCSLNISLIISKYDFPTDNFVSVLKTKKPKPSCLNTSVFIEKAKFSSTFQRDLKPTGSKGLGSFILSRNLFVGITNDAQDKKCKT